MDTLLRVFPVRTCSPGVLKRAQQSGRPCLLGYIDKCSAPCVGRVTPAEHRDLAEQFCAFMGGEAKRFIAKLERQMAEAVAELDYERAARLRDDIAALRKVFERNAVVLSEDTNADVFAVHQDELEAAVQVFHVRGGRIRGQRGWVVEKVEDSTAGRAGGAPAPAGLRRGRRGQRRHPAADPGAAAARERTASWPNGSAACAGAGWRSGCRSAGTRPRCWRPCGRTRNSP